MCLMLSCKFLFWANVSAPERLFGACYAIRRATQKPASHTEVLLPPKSNLPICLLEFFVENVLEAKTFLKPKIYRYCLFSNFFELVSSEYFNVHRNFPSFFISISEQ